MTKTFRITGPDGKAYKVTGPDSATPDQALQQFKAQRAATPPPAPAEPQGFGIDWAAPQEDVRAKIAALPDDEQRWLATKEWAAHRMADPQGADKLIAQTGSNAAGRSAMLNLADEFGAAGEAALSTVTGGYLGAPYDEALALRRAAEEKYDRENPITSTVGQVAGAVVTPSVIGTKVANAIRPHMGRAGQIATNVATGISTGAAGTLAAYVGGGEGGDGTWQQQLANRAEGAAIPTTVGGIIGGIIPGGAAAYRGARKLMARAGTPTRAAETQILERLPQSDPKVSAVDELADNLSVGSGSAKLDKNRVTFDKLGEEMVKAKGDRRVAIQATIQRLIKEDGLKPDAASARVARLAQAHKGRDLFIGEYPGVAKADMQTRTQRKPDLDDVRAVEETPVDDLYTYMGTAQGPGSKAARNEMAARATGARDNFRAWTGKQAPGGKSLADAEADLDALVPAMRAEYNRIHSTPGLVDESLLVNELTPTLNKHLDRLYGSSGEQAQALQKALDEFYLTPKTGPAAGMKISMNTLQQLQHARGAVRGMITREMRTGNEHIVNTLQPLYSDITDLMARASPEWKAVNDRWADGRISRETLGQFELMPLKHGPQQRAALKQFDKLAPELQDMARIGWLQQLDDRLANLGDSHDVAKLFTNEASRDVVERLFGREVAADFTRKVRDLMKANTTKTRAMGNSDTMPRQELHKSLDADANALVAMQGASVQDVRHWALQFFTDAYKNMKIRRMQPILTTKASDAPMAAMQVQKLRARKAALDAEAKRPRTPLPQMGVWGSSRVLGDGNQDEDKGYACGGRVKSLSESPAPTSQFKRLSDLQE